MNRNTTLCWQCSKSYAMSAAECPHCDAANGNHALDAAREQAQFVGMSNDAEPMAVYRGVSL